MKFRYLNKKRLINLFITLTLLGIVIISFFKIIFWIRDNKKNNLILKSIKDETNENGEKTIDDKTKINFENLKKKNTDTVAWIKLNNSVINYPIVKYLDNEYYLSHSFDKSNNSAGWIFMDYRNSINDNNIIIYGHNRKDGSMFGSLKKILNNYKDTDNRKITLYLPNENRSYIIYSAFIVKDENVSDYLKTSFESNNEFLKYIQNTTNYNQLNIKTNPDDIKNIITLYTCSGQNQKLLVFAYEI